MEINWENVMISILITMTSYMIVPLIFKIVNGGYEKDKAKKIALWNSIIVGSIYFILNSIYNNDSSSVSTWNPMPAVFYYYINKFILISGKKRERKNFSKIEEKTSKENLNIDESETQIVSEIKQEKILKSKKTKIRYCKICGGKLNQNKKCSKCGKQYFKFNKNLFLYIIIGILVFSNIYFISMYNDIKGIDEWCIPELYDLIGTDGYDYTKNKLEFMDEKIVFIIDEYDSYHYYSYDCVQKITSGEEYSFLAYNIDEAINQGYKKGSCY